MKNTIFPFLNKRKQMQEKRIASLSRAFDVANDSNDVLSQSRLNFLYSLEPLLHHSEKEIKNDIELLIKSRVAILEKLAANLTEQLDWVDNQKKSGVLEDPYYSTTVESMRSLNDRMKNEAVEMVNTAILVLRGEY